MSWFVGIFVSLALLGSDLLPCAAIASPWTNLLGVMVATLIAPTFAAVQSILTVRRWTGLEVHNDLRESAWRVLYAACLAIWGCCCLAIMTVFDWPSIVRANWGLDAIPLLDELVIAFPLVLAITLAWIMLHSAEQTLVADQRSPGKLSDAIAHAWQVAAGRLRLLFGLVFLPVAILFLLRDMVSLVVPSESSNQWMALLLFVNVAFLVCLYPVIISKTWKTRSIGDQTLIDRLNCSAQEFGLAPIRTRAWDTGGQMVNAVVVGILPKTRSVFLTDLLLKHFEPEEIEAIYRHELAHLRSGHLPLRLFYLLLPLGLATVIAWRTDVGDWLSQLNGLDQGGIFVWTCLAAAVLVYLMSFLNWTVRTAEIEADLVSCMTNQREFDAYRADIYRRAMLKMAAWTPELYARSTLFHPSIKYRLKWLSKCATDPQLANRFQRRFLLRQLLLISAMVFSLTFSLILF